MTNSTFDDAWNLPDVNYRPTYALSIGSSHQTHHPITCTILQQLAQDICSAISLEGVDGDQVSRVGRVLQIHSWFLFFQESIFTSLSSGSSWLVLDYGDDIANWNQEPTSLVANQLRPLFVSNAQPIIRTAAIKLGLDVDSRSNYLDKIHPDRVVHFQSPYPFNVASYLDTELARYDRIMAGLEGIVSGQGLVQVGIDNLYEVILKGGQALQNLTRRLVNLKSANTGDGVLGYDLKREKVDVIPKAIQHEPDVLGLVENRISAMTGLPSFIIWGHTDGDGYGIQTSLDLYSQRIGSMALLCLAPNVTYLAALIIGSEESVWATSRDIYPEKKKDVATRLEVLTQSLVSLISVGSITAIEARNTVNQDPDFKLSLDPNPQTTTQTTTQTDPTPDSGFEG